MKRFGIQIGNDGEMEVSAGNLSMGDTLSQNEYMLLMANKGELKEYPLMGAGITDMLNDNDLIGWKRKIRDAFKDDGLQVEKIAISQTGAITQLTADYR